MGPKLEFYADKMRATAAVRLAQTSIFGLPYEIKQLLFNIFFFSIMSELFLHLPINICNTISDFGMNFFYNLKENFLPSFTNTLKQT